LIDQCLNYLKIGDLHHNDHQIIRVWVKGLEVFISEGYGQRTPDSYDDVV